MSVQVRLDAVVVAGRRLFDHSGYAGRELELTQVVPHHCESRCTWLPGPVPRSYSGGQTAS